MRPIEINGESYQIYPNQRSFIAVYNETHRAHFNEDLFRRDVSDIIECLKNIILSAQRDQFFKIEVTGFREITSYAEVQERLRELESNSNNKRKRFNEYDYINLKPSSVMLLEVFYHLETEEEKCDTSVIIQVPIVVDKYYFRINGCKYSAMYQIVDASTYNNTSMGSAKVPAVFMKSAFSRTVVHRMDKKLTTINKETIPCTQFVCDIFANKISAEKFILCKFGLNRGIEFLNLHDIGYTKIEGPEVLDEKYYYFPTEITGICVYCPKYLYDNNYMYQSVCYCLVKSATQGYSWADLYTEDYWLEAQGAELKTRTKFKGLSFRESFEVSIDNNTYDHLRVTDEYKKRDAYTVLRWILQNHSALLLKDNTNIAAKRVRFGEYIAVHYARKLANNIKRVANAANKVSMKKLKQIIGIKHHYLIDQLKSSCTLVTYNNMVNDDDAIVPLSYSFKGISGIGENKTSAVQTKYKLVNPSHLGRLDMTDSSNSDPGMSGTLVPYAKLYEGGYFSDFHEPCKGRDELDKLYEEYKQMNSIVEVEFAKSAMLGRTNSDTMIELTSYKELMESISNAALKLNDPIVDVVNELPLVEDGSITIGTIEAA